MAADVSKDYRDPKLTSDDGTFRVSGWNSEGDASILIEDLVRGKVINPSDMALSQNQYEDWRWAGSGVNPPGAVAAAVMTEVNPNEWHWVFANNSVMAFPDQQIGHWYAEGTDGQPHIHPVSTTTELYTGTWTLYLTTWLGNYQGATRQELITMSAAFNKVMTAGTVETQSFDAVLPGAGRKISSCLTATLKLTLTAGTGLFLLGLDSHMEKDRLGSRQQFLK